MDLAKLIELVWALIEAIKALFSKTVSAANGELEARVRFPKIEFLRDLLSLLPLPDLSDAAGCRAFLTRCLTLGQKWVGTNEILLQALSVLQTLLANDNAWELLWGIFDKMVNADGGPESVSADPDIEAWARAAGANVGIDPFTIIAIITAAVNLLKFIRNWRQGQ